MLPITTVGSFYEVLRSILSLLLNADLDKEEFWAQACLPVRIGGLGVRKASQLASAAGCSSLVQEVLPSPALIAHGDNVHSALQLWSVGHSQLPPTFLDSLP